MTEAAAIPRQFRAAWVATVDNIDWPSSPTLTPSAQKQEIGRILDLAQRTNLNTLFVQIRPTADALYRSAIEPWSAFLTGTQGKAPSPSYDPLIEWIEGAHSRGIDLHAWINPYRVRHPKSIGPDTPDHLANKRPDLVRRYGSYLWLDPGEPGSREVVERIVDDILLRYDVDGIHMDDYFYPYPQDNKPFPDDQSYAAYRAKGGRYDRPLWRRDNVNTLVQSLSERIHRRKPGAMYTISPFGIWRPNYPMGVKSFDAYANIYSDSRHWLQEGWCDALMPQLYWPIESKDQPFEPLLNWWAEQNTKGRHLYPGLYLTRIKEASDTSESWEPDQILRQIELIDKHPQAQGYALFSMVGLLENRRGITDKLRLGPLAEPAITPESPWTGARRPARPTVRRVGDTLRARPAPIGGATRVFVCQWQSKGKTQTKVTPIAQDRDAVIRLPASAIVAGEVTVTAIGPNGITGAGTTLIV